MGMGSHLLIRHHKPVPTHNPPFLTTQTQHTTANMTQSKDQTIEERKANLPLPEQPPATSDWNSADASTVNVGSGRSEAEANNLSRLFCASAFRRMVLKITIRSER